MNKPKDVASYCSCGAELDGEGWTADRLCQMCWEGYCGDKFWEMVMGSDERKPWEQRVIASSRPNASDHMVAKGKL